MSIFHTPKCRIHWTDVMQGNTHNQAVSTASFMLKFDFSLDPSIWYTAGYFSADFAILQDDRRIGGAVFGGWTATDLPCRPAPELWLSYWWSRAANATNQRSGLFIFRPTIRFTMWASGTPIPGEFAVAEEDHYFLIE